MLGAATAAATAGGGGGIVSITSYNEWGEGTQIESAAVPRPGAPLEGAAAAEGRLLGTHLDYGDDPLLYLKIVQEHWRAASSWSAGAGEEEL